MDTSFHDVFLSTIKQPTDTNICISKKIETPTMVEETESIVEDYPVGDSRTRSAQSRLIRHFKDKNNVSVDFLTRLASQDSHNQYLHWPPNTPQWIKDVYESSKDTLTHKIITVDSFEKVKLQNTFNIFVDWIETILTRENIQINVNLRELQDVIIR